MEEPTLTNTATRCRREYYRKWRSINPEKEKLIKLRYWEKKAKQLYGEDYVPPLPGEVISKQARDTRRNYFREYQKKNAEAIKRNTANYWEKKAKEG